MSGPSAYAYRPSGTAYDTYVLVVRVHSIVREEPWRDCAHVCRRSIVGGYTLEAVDILDVGINGTDMMEQDRGDLFDVEGRGGSETQSLTLKF